MGWKCFYRFNAYQEICDWDGLKTENTFKFVHPWPDWFTTYGARCARHQNTEKYDKSSVKRLYRLSTYNNLNRQRRKKIEIFPFHCISSPCNIHSFTHTLRQHSNVIIHMDAIKRRATIFRFCLNPLFKSHCCSSPMCFVRAFGNFD